MWISWPRTMDKREACPSLKELADIHHICLDLGKSLEEEENGNFAICKGIISTQTHRVNSKIECIPWKVECNIFNIFHKLSCSLLIMSYIYKVLDLNYPHHIVHADLSSSILYYPSWKHQNGSLIFQYMYYIRWWGHFLLFSCQDE